MNHTTNRANRQRNERAARPAGLWLVAAMLVMHANSTLGQSNMEKIAHKGWANCLKLSNGDAEVIVTLDVGPRIVSYRLANCKNVFKEYADQLGKSGESTWQIRGGHRLWVAPEDIKRTYAPDNGPISYEVETDGSARFVQPADAFGIKKTMAVRLAPKGSDVTIKHTIENAGREATELAPWALTVMEPGGVEIIPQPPHAPHPGASSNAKSADDFLPNLTLVLWPYFDFTDPRWTFGKQYIFMRHMERGPTKIGISNSPGWAAYVHDDSLFVKRFDWKKGASYPDRGVNYETFSNEDMVEMESLGPLVRLGASQSIDHIERWSLFAGVGDLKSEADVERAILPRLK